MNLLSPVFICTKMNPEIVLTDKKFNKLFWKLAWHNKDMDEPVWGNMEKNSRMSLGYNYRYKAVRLKCVIIVAIIVIIFFPPQFRYLLGLIKYGVWIWYCCTLFDPGLVRTAVWAPWSVIWCSSCLYPAQTAALWSVLLWCANKAWLFASLPARAHSAKAEQSAEWRRSVSRTAGEPPPQWFIIVRLYSPVCKS